MMTHACLQELKRIPAKKSKGHGTEHKNKYADGHHVHKGPCAEGWMRQKNIYTYLKQSNTPRHSLEIKKFLPSWEKVPLEGEFTLLHSFANE